MKIENNKLAVGASVFGLALVLFAGATAQAQTDNNHKKHGDHTTTTRTTTTTHARPSGTTRTTTRTTMHTQNHAAAGNNTQNRWRESVGDHTVTHTRNNTTRTTTRVRVTGHGTGRGHMGVHRGDRHTGEVFGAGHGDWHRPSGIHDSFSGLTGVVIGRLGNGQLRVRCDDGSILIVNSPDARYFYNGNRIRLGGSGVQAGIVLGAILSRL